MSFSGILLFGGICCWVWGHGGWIVVSSEWRLGGGGGGGDVWRELIGLKKRLVGGAFSLRGSRCGILEERFLWNFAVGAIRI